MPEPLEALARHYGIKPVYRDLTGRRHDTSPETQRALLGAMGIAAATEADARESLAAFMEMKSAQLLPDMVVVTAGQAAEIPVRFLPRGRVLRWQIETEAGERVAGEARRSDLAASKAAPDTYALPLGRALPAGYHKLSVEFSSATAESFIICAPERAVRLADLGIARPVWGATAPLYGLRSRPDQDIGDFASLAALAEVLGSNGADFLGLNPVHALFPAAPEHYSPYTPSSREFLNVLHIAPELVPELEGTGSAAAADTGEFIDYSAASKRRHALFAQAFAAFRALPEAHPRRTAFAAFRASEGAALERLATFDALDRYLADGGGSRTSWRDWPKRYRSPKSPAAARFARENRHAVDYFAYLQWNAREQLAAAQARARASGMALGLYLDLAVGVAPGGADSWGDPALYARDVHLGAPGDMANPDGQDWELLPFNPVELGRRNYTPLIRMVRRAMDGAGALRIDHVLGLERQFWHPLSGAPAAYVGFPGDILRAILALESRRSRTLVIGEDLGTVPEGFRDRMAARSIYGTRIFYFEWDGKGGFKPPEDYTQSALASVTSHDLPTLAGYWAGRDIDWRVELGIAAESERIAQDRAERARSRQAILKLLKREGLLPNGLTPNELSRELAVAIHALVARARSDLVAIQLEDILGLIEQPNLPGTTTEHPNWRRRMPLTIDEIAQSAALEPFARALDAGRKQVGKP